MSHALLTHPVWPALQPYLYRKRSDMDHGKNNVEVRSYIPPLLLIQVKALRLPCPHCGKLQPVVRQRQKVKSDGQRIYLNSHYISLSHDDCTRQDKVTSALAEINVQVVIQERRIRRTV